MAAEMRRLYVEEIEYLDGHFGRLIEHLEAKGLWDDTVIVLVSDHGEEFAEHGGFWHGLTLYEEQIHVPLLVKWSEDERLAPPEVRGDVARLIDVAPTLLARAGAPTPAAMQGRDLADGVLSRPERDRIVFAEENHEGNVLRAVRTKRWKLIEANEGNPRGLPTSELFDVAEDPGETRDLKAQRPDAVAIMRGHLQGQQLAAEGGKVGEASSAQLSAAERAQLEALGYVQGDEEDTATP
jgi:arylsulfatase A-like enzyme